MSQRTVLIVEDEFLIRMSLAAILSDAGYRVLEAGCVLDAIAVLGQHDVDAVVTDVDMPGGLSGLDLARMLASTHPDADVIVVSGGRSVSRSELPPGARFLPKPYRFDAIAEMLGEGSTRVALRLAS
jgi:DNA-binding NtrC family response regulator